MASSSSSVDPPPPPEILQWLKTLPLAPEYHPTPAEFQDPIAYILKIEKEASQYGICKIVPPLPAAPKKTAISNINHSFAARQQQLLNSGGGGGGGGGSSAPKKPAPIFTTRQQQIGFCPRRPRPVQKPVWQSGEQYTLQQFEAKAKQFERAHLKKAGGGGGNNHRKGGGGSGLSPLEVETLFWKACVDKPFSVEYANDIPGSGFAPLLAGKKWRDGEAANVGETAWNMRGVSRAKGSLLKFMKEEIPGVTSPMVYVAMMFSWFAWHVEDHELHSLNYLHIGAGKTWYGVPRDAGLAFEEVVRVHGYGGEANPLVTFAILGEKTTVMPPEVLIGAGIPCCRLVQNAGEFVVTFPGAYHSGFSLGFNCGEAANIATPEWLRVAKEAAVRRASINYPPMVSHFQLLYELALSLCSRMPMSSTEPRSSRLKDKMKGEGEVMIKELFVQSVIQNNGLLDILLDKGLSCIVLPRNKSDISLGLSSRFRSQIKVKPRLSFGLCSREEALEATRSLLPDDVMLHRNMGLRQLNDFCSVEGNSISTCEGKKLAFVKCSKLGNTELYTSASHSQNMDIEKESTLEGDGLLDQGLLSCVTCGILSFSCVAVIQPTDKSARYLMSADCSSFNYHFDGSGVKDFTDAKAHNYDQVASPGQMKKADQDGFEDNFAHSSNYFAQVSGQRVDLVSDTEARRKGVSALDLLASAYGDSSDSEEEALQPVQTDENDIRDPCLASSLVRQSRHGVVSSPNFYPSEAPYEKELCLLRTDCQNGAESPSHPMSCLISGNEDSAENLECIGGTSDVRGLSSTNAEGRCQQKLEFTVNDLSHLTENKTVKPKNLENGSLIKSVRGLNSTEDRCGKLNSNCQSSETAKVYQSDRGMKKQGPGSADIAISPDSCLDSKATPKDNVSVTTQFSNLSASVPFMQRSDKDSSRMHVFCLEHALEVEKQLHPIGGAHLMLLCHPDYPKFEKEAKSLAEELGITYIWRDIHFREADKEDRERICAALEDEEAIPMNSDWAVKLGINLYYTANLSKSPLYSKQMPYNAVIYKAFGRTSSGGSPVKLKVYGKRHGRQKKIVVAGKWCGKVWMSNQVHPYLAHRHETQEQEHVEKFQTQGIDRKLDVEADTDNAKQVMPSNRNSLGFSTPAGRKSGKRKKSSGKSSAKKPRCTQVDDTSKTNDNLTKNSPAQSGRILRSTLTKQTTTPLCNAVEKTTGRQKPNLKYDTEGGPSTRLRRRPSMSGGAKGKPAAEKQIRKKKKAKKASSNDIGKKDDVADAEYPCDIEGCSMNFDSKQDLVLHKRNICLVEGCGKKFFSHKYLVQHRRVHLDDRPLKCPWKGCKMSFKWAWARTEHIRVHTGARPYVCKEAGCGQTFRFVSDFSRHRRKTGHVLRKGRG